MILLAEEQPESVPLVQTMPFNVVPVVEVDVGEFVLIVWIGENDGAAVTEDLGSNEGICNDMDVGLDVEVEDEIELKVVHPVTPDDWNANALIVGGGWGQITVVRPEVPKNA